MRTTLHLAVGAALLLIGVLIVGRFVAGRQPAVGASEVDCNKIVAGMTLREVEQVLGGPAGDYTTYPCGPTKLLLEGGIPMRPKYVWRGNGGEITVWFQSDRVHDAMYSRMVPLPSSWWESVLWYFKGRRSIPLQDM
jgi:hypothetical protein